MWVFDGEQWTEEGASEKPRTPNTSLPAYDESMPELQVIEQLPSPTTTTRMRYVPFPMP